MTNATASYPDRGAQAGLVVCGRRVQATFARACFYLKIENRARLLGNLPLIGHVECEGRTFVPATDGFRITIFEATT